MANSLNKVQLIGNMTANADIKQTPSGTKVATFTIATNKSWKDDKGNKQESVEFHNIVAWRGLADILEQYTEKGKKLYIEGELKTRSWEGDDGKNRYRTEIIADQIILLSNNSSNTSRRDDEPPAPAPSSKSRKWPKEEEIAIEDVPF